jgi:ribosomal protein S18 acetylase RimI-like enzyme
MQQIKISKASINDIQLVIAISKETFIETFADSNTKENMKKYLTENFNEDKLGTELNNPESLFYLAFEGEDVIGYLKLNFGAAQTELKDDDALEIERIYVKGEYHGKKVGQMLYEQALTTAAFLGKLFVWLGVWEQNVKAIRFYEKNGFVAFNKHIFVMGEDEQTDIMMKKML